MVDWAASAKHRLAVLLTAYFTLHVVARTCVSPTLGFDESEQAYLCQSLQLGYNSQPPLYTWIQAGLFELFGCSAFALALLKNLFLLGTYWLVYATTRIVTRSARLAVVAALGLLLIPQIAWESHRDLSHTVAATFTTTLLLFAILKLKSLRDAGATNFSTGAAYALIGVAVGAGVMFKYNFGIVVVGFVVAGLWTAEYRRLIVRPPLLLTAMIAAAIIAPHAVWVAEHPDLASSKTIATLTTGESVSWWHNVSTGMIALTVSTISCTALMLMVMLVLVARLRDRPPSQVKRDESWVVNQKLLERFLITVGMTLFVLVLSGHALEFKNRWLQPFLCVLPIYLTVRFGRWMEEDVAALNRVGGFATTVMVLVLVATVLRPVIQGGSGRHSHLNIPYADAARQLADEVGFVPRAILAMDMRTAGNLRVAFPEAQIVARELPIALDRFTRGEDAGDRVLLFNEHDEPRIRSKHSTFAGQVLGTGPEFVGWKSVSAPFIHGRGEERMAFHYVVIEKPARIAESPTRQR